MPRKPVDIKPTDYPILRERGLLHPFPAFRRGRVRAEPANGSRDWSLVGFGATPQGLKSPISALFKVRLGLLFSAQLFHRLLDTTKPVCFLSIIKQQAGNGNQILSCLSVYLFHSHSICNTPFFSRKTSQNALNVYLEINRPPQIIAFKNTGKRETADC